MVYTNEKGEEHGVQQYKGEYGVHTKEREKTWRTARQRRIWCTQTKMRTYYKQERYGIPTYMYHYLQQDSYKMCR